MSAQDNLHVIRTYWDALQHPGDASLKTMMQLMDEQIGWAVVPLGLKRQGKEQMRQLIEGSWQTPHQTAGTRSPTSSPARIGSVWSTPPEAR
jgi:hypothetical protein